MRTMTIDDTEGAEHISFVMFTYKNRFHDIFWHHNYILSELFA